MIDAAPAELPFQAHLDLLRLFEAHRRRVVGAIESVLNAQRKPARYLQDRALLSRDFEDCFFGLAAVTDAQAGLRGRLEEAHWAGGLKPRYVAGLHNDLIHPTEMMMRGFYCWQQTRWPGRNGRERYAETLFNVYLVRCLVFLSMRLWDEGAASAGDRLTEVQALLDALWQGSPDDQPVLVRDARWLIPLALSPTTDDLSGYFEVARHVAESFRDKDRIEVSRAQAHMIGGHLTSQIRHYCVKDGLSIDDDSVVRRTRTSNALDFALLIQDLVPLLEAYSRTLDSGDEKRRSELVAAICQGISPDPELFVNRADLLGAYSLIEHLFVATGEDGRTGYTPMGRHHVALVEEYSDLIGRLAGPLHEDCLRSRPVDGAYSPFGAIFGTPSNLLEHMALKALDREGSTAFSLEDVFSDGSAGKLGWVNGWRRLPHIPVEVQRLHEYPQGFAREIFDRIGAALRRRLAAREATAAPRTGRLFVVSGDGPSASAATAQIPDLPTRYIGSSDKSIVAAAKAEACDEAQILNGRREGYFVLSFETPGGWMAVRKDFLTEVLGTGQDARIVGLPAEAAAVLRLMCRDLLAGAGDSRESQASVPPSMSKA